MGVGASSHVTWATFSNCTKSSPENTLFILTLTHPDDGQDLQQRCWKQDKPKCHENSVFQSRKRPFEITPLYLLILRCEKESQMGATGSSHRAAPHSAQGSACGLSVPCSPVTESSWISKWSVTNPVWLPLGCSTHDGPLQVWALPLC